MGSKNSKAEDGEVVRIRFQVSKLVQQVENLQRALDGKSGKTWIDKPDGKILEIPKQTFCEKKSLSELGGKTSPIDIPPRMRPKSLQQRNSFPDISALLDKKVQKIVGQMRRNLSIPSENGVELDEWDEETFLEDFGRKAIKPYVPPRRTEPQKQNNSPTETDGNQRIALLAQIRENKCPLRPLDNCAGILI